MKNLETLREVNSTKTFNLLWQYVSKYVDAAFNSSCYFVRFIVLDIIISIFPPQMKD